MLDFKEPEKTPEQLPQAAPPVSVPTRKAPLPMAALPPPPRDVPAKMPTAGVGVSKKLRLSNLRKPSELRLAERIKLDDDGRSELPFLKSERT